MSTSPEAKQAAESIARSRGEDAAHDLDLMFIQGAIDAATAKLRGELELTKACLDSQVPELMRAVDENLQRVVTAEGELGTSLRYVARLEQQLAHQQSGAPTPEVEKIATVYAWLGQWRDKMPEQAVAHLQDVLGPLYGRQGR